MASMRLTLTLYLLLGLPLSISVVQGQVHESETFPGPAVFGEIPDSLFDYAPAHDYPYDYLLKNADVRFYEEGGQIGVELVYHFRLKVYSDDPLQKGEAALISIPYYDDGNLEEIAEVEALTHQPDGSVTALDEDEMHSAELNSRYRVLEFIMPDVQQGSVIEYRYTIHRNYIDELPDFSFSHQVPTRLAHLSVHNVDYLRYDAIESNLDFDVHYHEQKIDTSSIPLVFTYKRPEPVSVEHWFARDIPAVENAAYISSLNDLRGRLHLQISEFGKPRQPLENSWEFVVAQLRRRDYDPFRQAGQLNSLMERGRELAEEAGTAKQIRDTIFSYVNQTMLFNGEKRAFHETPLTNVLNGEPSDQAAVNLVLMAMLDGAGIAAYPVYLSGRDFGRINREFPSLYQFNQMLVATENDGHMTLMDASFSHSRPGLIAVDSYNHAGLVLKREAFDWVRIQPEHSYFDLDVDFEAELSPEGGLTGSVKVIAGGYPARRIWEGLSAEESAGQVIRSAFFESYAGMELTRAEIREQRRGSHTVVLSADFHIPDYAISFREGLQFRPMIIGTLQENPFEKEERTSAVILDAPEFLHVRYKITLPEGYELEKSRMDHATTSDGARLQEEYESSGRTLFYTFMADISRREFAPENYRSLRRLYDRWVFLSHEEWFIDRRGAL
ncbi:MAG: DUF3857 domain-containing protein [Balneolaceae bacterium]